MCLDNSKNEDEKQNISEMSTFYSNSNFELSCECSIKIKVCKKKIDVEHNEQCLYKITIN